MSLSSDLISEFVKVTKDDEKPKSETVVYGTTVVYEGSTYVKLDGSDLLTPVSTTSATKNGERVTVMIKDHTATITGNMSSPSARSGDVEDIAGDVKGIADQISEFEIVIAEKLTAAEGEIDTLQANDVTITEKLTAAEGEIDTLQADNVTITKKLTAAEGQIENLNTDKLSARDADLKYATIGDLEATNGKFNNLDSTYAKIDVLNAQQAQIDDLKASKLSAEQADLKYANIDFANIGEAAFKKIFSESGIIENLVVSEGTVTGELVGVTIKGDIIEGGTVIADKLVVKGSDGLFYKLNTDGITTTAEQTEYNSLSGTVITAKSITAEKVDVDDLVAFEATIGGFNITKDAIYSGKKQSAENTTSGVYLDKEGQLSVGDSNDYLRYFKDEKGEYKLEISASSILMKLGGSSSNLEGAIDTVEKNINYLAEKTEYISVGTDDDDNPYIELGKKDSDFKLRITNEKLELYDGSSTPAYISNQKLMIKKAEVIDELRFGNFVWAKRPNGNVGLTWGEENN